MKKYEELMQIEERQARYEIRNGLRADVAALKAAYRETREGTPAETVAAYIAAVGYNRAAVAIGTLVNRHAWDGRISRRAAAWAAALPEAWDEKTAVEIGLYVDDVIHLAHFDQIVSAFMKAEPDPDPDKRPETISEAEAAPEAVQEAPAQETAPEVPEAVQAPAPEAEQRPEIISEAAAVPEAVALAPEAFRAAVEAAPRCGLPMDIQGDCLRYKTIEGRARCIYTETITADDHAARIVYRNGSGRGQIRLERGHDCFIVAAVAAGTVSPSDALWDITATAGRLLNVSEADRDYFRAARKPAGKRKEEMKANMQLAAKLADQAACIVKNAADGIPLFIDVIADQLKAVAETGMETGLGLTAAKHTEAVAAWLREVYAACIKAAQEAAAERPETISAAEAVPEAVQDAPEAEQRPETISAAEAQEAAEADPGTVVLVETCYDIRNGGQTSRRVLYSVGNGLQEIREAEAAPEAPEAEQRPETISAADAAPDPVQDAPAALPAPEAAPAPVAFQQRRQAPEKPPRGPAKEKDFAGSVITGPGWQIAFDVETQRTRVSLSEAVREKAAEIVQAAGFYYSVNMDSWNKKLTHKAHRAALALADKLRAALA